MLKTTDLKTSSTADPLTAGSLSLKGLKGLHHPARKQRRSSYTKT